jgi:hypothetical protein
MGFPDVGMMGPYPNWVKFADNRCLVLIFARMHHRFDRISKPPHADSEFEEAQVKGRTGYFIIAILLTLLNAAVTVYSGVAIWKAWPGEIWDRGLLLLLAALGATSVVNVWVPAVFESGVLPGSRNEECVRGAAQIRAEARGFGNV